MKRTATQTNTKTRSGLGQTLLAAAALLGLSLLILLTTGCGRNEASLADTTDPQTIEERERAVALAERELTLAEREATVAERELRLQDRVARTPSARPVYSDRSTSLPQVVDVFDPVEPTPSVRRSVEPTVYRRTVDRYESVSVPAGTTLDLELLDSLSSATARVGQSVEARVASDVYSGGRLVIPAGARVSGTVAEAAGLRKIGGRAKLALAFDRVELASGVMAPMNASYVQLGRRETARDAATIGGATAAGAILGNQVNGRHRDQAKVIGAIVGAGVGTAIAHRTNGGEITMPAGLQIAVALDSPIHVGDRA